MADEQLKIVIRGLPFEAQKEEVRRFFNVDDQDLTMLTWPDSGRCKGVAFVDCATLDEKRRLQGFEGQEFEAEGNRREISISDYEERAPRGRRQRKGGRRNDTRGDRRQNDQESTNNDTAYTEDDETGREVYVSNVSFDATEEDFNAHFSGCGEIESVTIPTLFTSGRPKGFAFVRFATRSGRDQALLLDESSMLDRNIGVRENRGRAQRNARPAKRERKQRTGLSDKPDGCTTIFVGNLPWSTGEDELKALFADKDCGPIVSTRIVRQSWTNRSRGFGYVEFQNEANVDSAVQMQLFLEGRELRLDYAENLSHDDDE